MGLLPLLLTWSALALIASISPGPDTLVVAGHAARNGLRAGLAAAAGIVTGGLWYMLLFGIGFLRLLNAWPTLFLMVKTGGALYLAFLGAKLLIGAAKAEAHEREQPLKLSAPFRQALLTNALNPKVALFYLAVLPQFVGTGSNAPAFGMLLIAIHYAIGGAWMMVLAIGASHASGAIRRSKGIRWIEGALGAAFIGLAGKLAISRI